MVMLFSFGSVGRGFCLRICATSLVTSTELRKAQPSDMSWRHLSAKRAFKSRQFRLTQQQQQTRYSKYIIRSPIHRLTGGGVL
ncbi:hypothetical protein TNCV_4872391 [Trichonephila clavipes]|nr:hypothetical protein TNCV_4872391 [Trichonephila clavipes]